jgi:predicted enzyme related to lactoylglutathione lyase
MLKKVAFTMYPVQDLNRAQEFYKKNLGLVPSSVLADGGWVEYDLPEGGCFALTNIVPDQKSSKDTGGTIAFEVDDLPVLVSKLKANGVEFKLDVFPTPVCSLAVIIDSEGNAVTLHQLKHKKG